MGLHYVRHNCQTFKPVKVRKRKKTILFGEKHLPIVLQNYKKETFERSSQLSVL